MENGKTLAWKLYELGRNYNNALRPNQYAIARTNWEFFTGNQWLNMSETEAMQGLPRPTFNILKRVAQLFIASLTSTNISIQTEAMTSAAPGGMGNPGGVGGPMGGGVPGGMGYPGGMDGEETENLAKFATSVLENLLEKFKFEYRVREALLHGAVTGDYCAHFYFDPEALAYDGFFGEQKGEIQMELLEGTQVMFGNPNLADVEQQPYILVVGRDTTENLKAEARRFRENVRRYRSGTAAEPEEENGIQADGETQDFSNQTELDADDGETGKALYVLLYTKAEQTVTRPGPDGMPVKKKEVTVHVTKATKSATIYEDVDTGLSVYPLAWGNWEKQQNNYHGRALVTGMVPNQIYINRLFAMVMQHLMTTAFPKVVYNADLIPEWTNVVGEAIGVRELLPGQAIPQVATTLPVPEMSAQVYAAIEKAMTYTKDCLGATDAQLGNVRPENTSALMVLQTNAEVPLENIRAGLHEWVENIGRILLDMVGTYYGVRGVTTERQEQELAEDAFGAPRFTVTGQLMTRTVTKKTVVPFDFDRLKHLWLDMRVDVGADTYFSRIAMVQTLDNLRREGVIDLKQYLERIPDRLIPQKEKLLQELEEKQFQGEELSAQTAGGGASTAFAQGGPVDESTAFQSLPNAMQNHAATLDGVARRTALQMGARRAQ